MGLALGVGGGGSKGVGAVPAYTGYTGTGFVATHRRGQWSRIT